MEMENVVFDMGGVLIKWTPDEVLDNAEVKGEEDRRILKREVFFSQEWAMMDWGVLDEEEAEKMFTSRLPSRLHKYLHSILYWDERIGFVEGMDQVLSYLSSQKKGIYLLSNASHRLNSLSLLSLCPLLQGYCGLCRLQQSEAGSGALPPGPV